MRQALLGGLAGIALTLSAVALVLAKPAALPLPDGGVAPILWAPVYQLSGAHMAAAAAALDPACTADVWGTSSDGGQVRLILRADGDGGLQVVDGGQDFPFLVPDGGVVGLQ